ncbi:hypothetical protein FrCorBMG51_23720 [Protofrankia coriariae]|uniref:Phosphoglycerate kinase n=1 Tax=Protofrankia coriariae TaxID=1562887 RepID=A0ABR5EYR7_9ACTN|nr:hypothetical protein FrCorBMG51_23720 [Protofrankia coriariae]
MLSARATASALAPTRGAAPGGSGCPGRTSPWTTTSKSPAARRSASFALAHSRWSRAAASAGRLGGRGGVPAGVAAVRLERLQQPFHHRGQRLRIADDV